MQPPSRTRIGVGIAALAVAAIVVVLVNYPGPPVRQIDGRPVEHWIRAAASGKEPAAELVLQRADPECLPDLARWAGDPRSALDRAIRNWRPRLPGMFQTQLPDSRWRDACTLVSLRALARHTNWGTHAALILREVATTGVSVGETERASVFDAMHRRVRRDPGLLTDTNLMAAVIGGVTNRNPWIQYHSIAMLGLAGPRAISALPVVRWRLSATGRTIAQHAAGTVWRISGERREPLVVLLLSLTSRDQPTLDWAHRYLFEMAPETQQSLPGWKALMADNPPTAGTPRRALLPSNAGPGGPVVHQILEKLSTSKDADLAAAAQEALERLNQAGGSPKTGP